METAPRMVTSRSGNSCDANSDAEYTEAQLVAFRSGERANNAQMSTIASKMSDVEMKAVADYIAGLR